MAAHQAPSVTDRPLTLKSVRLALEKVWARTPSRFVVLEWYPMKTTPSKLSSMPCIMPERAGAAPHQLHVRGQLVHEQVLEVAVGVDDHELARPCLARGGDGGVGLLGHELAEAAVLEALGSELGVGNDSGDAFHVDDHQDPASVPSGRRSRGDEKGDEGGQGVRAVRQGFFMGRHYGPGRAAPRAGAGQMRTAAGCNDYAWPT